MGVRGYVGLLTTKLKDGTYLIVTPVSAEVIDAERLNSGVEGLMESMVDNPYHFTEPYLNSPHREEV